MKKVDVNFVLQVTEVNSFDGRIFAHRTVAVSKEFTGVSEAEARAKAIDFQKEIEKTTEFKTLIAKIDQV